MSDDIFAKAQLIADELEHCLNTDIPLTPEEEEYINLMYGVNEALAVDPVPNEPASISECLAKAQQSIAKLKKKGYPIFEMEDLSDPNSYAIYKRSITSALNNGARVVNLEVNEEKSVGMWKNSEFFKERVDEIRGLPFFEVHERVLCINQYIDATRKLTRVLAQNNKYKYRDKKRSVMDLLMLDFMREARKIQKDIASAFVIQGKIDETKLTALQRKTLELHESCKVRQLPRHSPKVNAADLKEIEIFESKLVEESKLPPLYRPTTIALSESTMNKDRKRLFRTLDAFPKRVNDIVSRPASLSGEGKLLTLPSSKRNSHSVMVLKTPQRTPLISPRNAPPKIEEHIDSDEIRRAFWREEDPLAGNRTGMYIDTLKDMQVPDAIFDNAYMHTCSIPKPPFKLNADRKPPPIPKEEVQRRPLELIEGSPDLKNSAAYFKTMHEIKQHNQSLLKQNYEYQNFENAKYLLTQEEFVELVGNGQSDIYDKLDKVWTELGFSIQQKLTMVIKYSKNLEESNKLGDALKYWQNALLLGNQFISAYKSLKYFLQHEQGLGSSAVANYLTLKKDFDVASDGIRHTITLLKETYGDELILNRRVASDLVISYRNKISMIVYNCGLDRVEG